MALSKTRHHLDRGQLRDLIGFSSSGFTRQDLWYDAERTRVLPSQHQEAIDGELAKRAAKERAKREKKKAKAAAGA